MKTYLFTHTLIGALMLMNALTFAQENPWQTKSSDNPWDKNADQNTEITNETQISAESNQPQSTNLKVNEVLFIYDEYTTSATKGSYELNKEMNRHVMKTYKSAPMFWTTYATGLLLNVFSIPVNLIASGLPSKRTNAALVDFDFNNPNMDQQTLKKYHRKLRLKKFASGIGGTAAGIATVAGIILILILI